MCLGYGPDLSVTECEGPRYPKAQRMWTVTTKEDRAVRTFATVGLMLVFAVIECPPNLAIAEPGPQRNAVVRPTASQTDRAVLATVLNHEFASDKGTIVLEARTATTDTDRRNTVEFGLKKGRMKPVLKGEPARKLGEAVVSDWMRRNRKPTPLPPLRADRKVIMLTHKEQERIFAHGWWPAFYKRFPNSTGLTRVSLPGYSKDGSEAVVMLGNQRQGRWGHGTLYFLVRDNGRWRVSGKMGLWVS